MLSLAEPADCFRITSSLEVTLNNARHVFLFRMLTETPDSKSVQRGMRFACFGVFPAGQRTLDYFCSSSHSPPCSTLRRLIFTYHPHTLCLSHCPELSLPIRPLDRHTALIWTWELGQKHLQLLSISYRKEFNVLNLMCKFWTGLALSWLALSPNVLAFSLIVWKGFYSIDTLQVSVHILPFPNHLLKYPYTHKIFSPSTSYSIYKCHALRKPIVWCLMWLFKSVSVFCPAS